MTLPATATPAERRRLPSLTTQAIGAARRVRRLAARPSLRPWLVGITALLFVALVVGSFRALPSDRDLRPGLLVVLVLVATPSTLVLNALQYRTMAAALGHRIGLRGAMRVSIVATLVNYLPIPAPGGIAVRTAALARRGSTIRSAVSINAVTGVLWAGTAAVIAGLALEADSDLEGRGGWIAALGAVALVASGLMLRRTTHRWRQLFLELLLTQAGLVVTSGVRVWLSLAAIGQPASLGAALAISGSTVIAAMIGIAPAGLGLREAIAGGLAAAVDVPAAAAVAASAVDRLASQVGLVLCAPLTGLRWSDLRGRTGVATGEPPAGDEARGAVDVDETGALEVPELP